MTPRHLRGQEAAGSHDAGAALALCERTLHDCADLPVDGPELLTMRLVQARTLRRAAIDQFAALGARFDAALAGLGVAAALGPDDPESRAFAEMAQGPREPRGTIAARALRDRARTGSDAVALGAIRSDHPNRRRMSARGGHGKGQPCP